MNTTLLYNIRYDTITLLEAILVNEHYTTVQYYI